ncbi:hypothetical protein C6Y14_12155 [Streptomyces dioscori]|uniref:Uncharacterized protein n=1 Tax=Streptomyces dioscori TaxID=2109333 RepID=A0A2P8Q9M3_9ACTN|nr:hypothetical protein [Streptomyces dioscori]PSM42935.1 hypothetical protein C6Y14_12155 [Streptomyces dioscori]
MYILVPDDPVFFARFQSLEEPLLRRLYRLHGSELESDAERIISDAYDSWVQVLLTLPFWSQWQGRDEVSAGLPRQERPGYVLYGHRGNELTSLYPTNVAKADLEHLKICLDLFVENDMARCVARGQAGTEACVEPSERQEDVNDAYRRVMKVLLLSPPQLLLHALRDVGQQRPGVASVTLLEEQEVEYRRYCQGFVTILSEGDTFAYRSHRAMYL